MAINFRIAMHHETGVPIVEILVDGEVGGVVYPVGDKSIKLVSAYISTTGKENGFAGKVVKDDGVGSWPPIPAISVEFELSPFEISEDRIVKLPYQIQEVNELCHPESLKLSLKPILPIESPLHDLILIVRCEECGKVYCLVGYMLVGGPAERAFLLLIQVDETEHSLDIYLGAAGHIVQYLYEEMGYEPLDEDDM